VPPRRLSCQSFYNSRSVTKPADEIFVFIRKYFLLDEYSPLVVSGTRKLFALAFRWANDEFNSCGLNKHPSISFSFNSSYLLSLIYSSFSIFYTPFLYKYSWILNLYEFLFLNVISCSSLLISSCTYRQHEHFLALIILLLLLSDLTILYLGSQESS
jgi:hypothetical protein